MIEIDGSFGEGGGQVVRTAIALASVLGKPLHIRNVRKNRSKPGLRHQHVLGIQILEKVTEGKSEGVTVDSEEFYFFPGKLRGINLTANVGTAGSVTLVVQSILLPLLFAPEPSRVKIIGGTDVDRAPTADYMKNVFLRFVRAVGGEVSVQVLRRGFMPAGGGVILLEVKPLKKPLSPLKLLERGPEVTVRGVSVSGGLGRETAERQAKSALRVLSRAGLDADIELDVRSRSEVLSPGGSITLWTEEWYIGSDNILTKGNRPEVIGMRTANLLLRELDSLAPVDRYMGDQMIPFLALADGESIIRVSALTSHTLTNLSLIARFTGAKYEVEGSLLKPATIKIEGIGLDPDEVRNR